MYARPLYHGGPLHLAFRAREGSGDVADDEEGVFPPRCPETGSQRLAMVKLAQKSRELPSSNKILLTNCHIRV